MKNSDPGDGNLVELLERLDDENVVVRERIVKMLVESGNPLVVSTLIDVLRNDREWRVQKAAAEGLEEFGTKKNLAPLMEALKEKDKMIRQAAVEALSHETRAVEPLISLLMDKDRSVRLQVISLLKDIGDRNAVLPLMAILGDPDANVRKSVVSALGVLKDPSSIDELIIMLKDNDEGVREESVRALGMLMSEHAIDPLINILGSDEPNENARNAAKEVLETFRDKAIKPLLGAIIESTDGTKRDNIKDILKHLFNQYLRFEEELNKARKTVRKKKLITRKISPAGTNGKDTDGKIGSIAGDGGSHNDVLGNTDGELGGTVSKRTADDRSVKGAGLSGTPVVKDDEGKAEGGGTVKIKEEDTRGERAIPGDNDNKFRRIKELIAWKERGLLDEKEFRKLKEELL